MTSENEESGTENTDQTSAEKHEAVTATVVMPDEKGEPVLSRFVAWIIAIIAVLAAIALMATRIAWFSGSLPWQQLQYGDAVVTVADKSGDPISGCVVSLRTVTPSVTSPSATPVEMTEYYPTNVNGKVTYLQQIAGEAQLLVYCTPRTSGTTCKDVYDACLPADDTLLPGTTRYTAAVGRMVTIVPDTTTPIEVTVDKWHS